MICCEILFLVDSTIFQIPKSTTANNISLFLIKCRAKAELDAGVVVVETWEEVCGALDNKKLLVAPFCGEIPCEDLFKKESARCPSQFVLCDVSQQNYCEAWFLEMHVLIKVLNKATTNSSDYHERN